MFGMMAAGIKHVNAEEAPTTAFYNGFDLNGINQDVVSSSISPSMAGYTVSVWFKTSFTGAQRPIRSEGAQGDLLWQINATHPTDKIVIANDNLRLAANIDVSDGVLHHGLMSANGSDTVFYLDGVDVGSTTNVGTHVNLGGPIYIGSNLSSELYFNGSITMPMILNRNVSPSEALVLYNGGKPQLFSIIPTSITDNAVLYYEMSSNDSTLEDESSGGNDGTGNNGITSDGDSIEWQIA